MTKKTFKYVANVLVTLLILAGTFYLLFRDQEFEQIMERVRDARKGYLFVCIILMFTYVSSESVIYHYLVNQLSYKVKAGKCFLISCIGFFFSAITPSASGGQPLQVYYLTHCGVDAFVGTLVAMVVTVFFKIVLLFLCGIMMIVEPGTFFGALDEVKVLFAIGFMANLLFIVFLGIVIFNPSLAFTMITKLVLWAGRKRILKNPEKTLKKAIQQMNQYEKGALFIKKHLSIVPPIFITTLIQRLCYFSIAFMVYKSFGLSGTSFFEMLTLQIVLSLSVDVLPLPGAAGAHENVFVMLFEGVFGAAVLPGMLMCRSITFYVLVIVAGLFSAFGHIYLTKLSKKVREKKISYKRKKVTSE